MGLCWGWEHPPGQQGGSVFTAKIKSAPCPVLPGEGVGGILVFFPAAQNTAGIDYLSPSPPQRVQSYPIPSSGAGHAPG